jgi:hypothetical protein
MDETKLLDLFRELARASVDFVATPRAPYLMKRDTVRPQDRADAARLEAAFGLDD